MSEDICQMVNSVNEEFYRVFEGHYPIFLEINYNTQQELVALFTQNCLIYTKDNQIITKYRVFDLVINNDLKDYEYKIVYPKKGWEE